MPLSAAGQRWDSSDAVFVRQLMEDFADESVREIVILCSAQSAKTLTLLCLLAWLIAEDPGPVLWVTSSKQEARKLSKSRLMQLLERCAPVAAKLPSDRHMKTSLEVYFPGAPLVIGSAENPRDLQSTPYRYIIMDEARSYPPGAVEMLNMRFRAFSHNYKKITITTPGLDHDSVHRAFLDGNRQHFETQCPCCGHYQELLWKEPGDKGGLKWDTNDITRPGGKGAPYNFDELLKTVRYECEYCGHRITDTLDQRKFLSGHGRWRPHHRSAPSNIRSYTWNALLPYWANWGMQVREFLTAKEALKWNDHEPMKKHQTETRGLPWEERLRYLHDEKFLDERMRDYDPFKPWLEGAVPLEKRRFLTIDVQGAGGRHYYVVIRAWGIGGRSRLLYHGKHWNIDEIRQLQRDWEVHSDNVMIDAGNWQAEVFQYIIDSGYHWKAMKGDEVPFFRIEGQQRMFTVTEVDPAIGTALAGRVRPIKLWVFSKPATLDRLKTYQHGLAGDWQIFPGVSEEYRMQVTATRRVEHDDPRKGIFGKALWKSSRHDHYEDCERMQIIGAVANDLLSAPVAGLPLFDSQGNNFNNGN
ncbi:MAG: phage terminase large subunit family protein [Verrucomicrobiales bacterium]|nr:phage terminase large subunit family protein [Verrucomicrobiales bacterium]